MKRVIIESPYVGNVAANLEYLKECILDSLDKGEAPFASHGFFTQYLDDLKPDERELGIKAGFVWGQCAELRALYIDLGTSHGMYLGLLHSEEIGLPTEKRSIKKTCGACNTSILASERTARVKNWALYGDLWICSRCVNRDEK